MNSVEKVNAALDHLMNASDEDLAEAIPLPSGVVIAAMPFIADILPSDPAALDEFLTNVGDFCHSMRSDRDPVLDQPV
jgi:hypothetical protein